MSIAESIQKYLELTRLDMIKVANSRGQNTSGKVGKSLRVEIDGDSGKLYGFEWIVQAWETGRGPGKKPPRQNILKWIERKGIATGKDAESMSYAVMANIAKLGTQLYRGADSRFSKPTGTITDSIEKHKPKLLNDLLISTRVPILNDIKAAIQ